MPRPVCSCAEDSPSGLWRSPGTRVGLTALAGSNPASSAMEPQAGGAFHSVPGSQVDTAVSEGMSAHMLKVHPVVQHLNPHTQRRLRLHQVLSSPRQADLPVVRGPRRRPGMAGPARSRRARRGPRHPHRRPAGHAHHTGEAPTVETPGGVVLGSCRMPTTRCIARPARHPGRRRPPRPRPASGPSVRRRPAGPRVRLWSGTPTAASPR